MADLILAKAKLFDPLYVNVARKSFPSKRDMIKRQQDGTFGPELLGNTKMDGYALSWTLHGLV
jgi:hypothetical protein